MANKTGVGGWAKGNSGNPAGRPPSGQAYSEILRKAGGKTEEYQGRRIARNRLVAEYLWQLAIYRKVKFPDGSEISPDPEAWMDLVWRIFAQMDGLPRQNLDVTSAGEKVQSNVIEVMPIDYRLATSNLAPRSVGDSTAPGESQDTFDGEKVG